MTIIQRKQWNPDSRNDAESNKRYKNSNKNNEFKELMKQKIWEMSEKKTLKYQLLRRKPYK